MKKEIKGMSWRNVLTVLLIALIGFVLGTITNMLFTLKYIDRLLR